MCRFLCGYKFQPFFYMITSMFSLINCQTLVQNDYRFESSPAMNESFARSLSLTAFDVVSVLDFDYFNKRVMVSYFCFNFHFLVTYDVKYLFICFIRGFPGGTSQVALSVKNPPANSGDISDMGLIPGLGKSTGRGHVNQFQHSCLKNPYGQRSLAGYSP